MPSAPLHPIAAGKTHEFHFTRANVPDLSAHCRAQVEAGADDRPVDVWIEGKLCLHIHSLHRYALMTYTEEPALRLVPWTPHPRATVGPRVQALLDKRAEDRRLTREYGPCLT